MRSETTRRIAMSIALVVAMLATMAIVATPSADAQTVRNCRGAKGQLAFSSSFGFDETYDRLEAALRGNPNINVIAEIDHAAAADMVGLDLDPNRVIVFGNPALGTPIMALNQQAGIDLPQKIQVYTRGNTVCVGYNAVLYLRHRHNVREAPTLETITGALANFTAVATETQQEPKRILNRWINNDDRLITEASNADFETTWARLNAAIVASPANVAFTVDHGANSGGVLNPTRLVVFGNPNLGTPIMQARATAGIDLPLKVLVWEDDDGITQVTVNDPDLFRRRHRMGSVIELLTPLAGATANFLNVATQGPPS